MNLLERRSVDDVQPSTSPRCSTSTRGTAARRTGAAIFIAALALSGLRFYRLRTFQNFIDESDTIVAGWLISEGERLYDGVFSHHMPLGYIAAHAVAAFSPTDHFAHFRVVPWLSYAVVAWSLVRRADGRTWFGSTVFLALVSVALPPLSGQMLLTDTLWGAAFALFFVRLLLPFLLGWKLSRLDAAVGGAALATVLLGSLTVVYPIAAALAAFVATLAVVPERRRSLRAFAGAFALAFTLVAGFSLAWMQRFGSLAGFFDQALIFNLVAYAPFNAGTSTPRELVSATFWAWKVDFGLDPVLRAPEGIKLVLTLLSAATGLFAAGAIARSASRRPGHLDKIVSCIVAPTFVLLLFLFLRMRGAGFHAAPLYVVVFASIGLGFDLLWSRGRTKTAILGAVAVLLPLLVTAAKDPTFRAGYPSDHATSGIDEIAGYIRDRTIPSDLIAAFPESPLVYLEAKRKPAVASVFYFPWQAFWERGDAPLPATCQQLLLCKPRFVFLAPQRIWDKFDWEDYAECADRVIRRDYVQVDPDRFQGQLWERSPLEDMNWDRLRRTVGGRFGLTTLDAGGASSPGPADVTASGVDRRTTHILRAAGWAEEDSGESLKGRIFVVLAEADRQIAVPAKRATDGRDPNSRGRWRGWSAVLYPQEIRAGTYDVIVRVVRTGQDEYLESSPLAKIVLR
jgi:hypothetical protein